MPPRSHNCPSHYFIQSHSNANIKTGAKIISSHSIREEHHILHSRLKSIYSYTNLYILKLNSFRAFNSLIVPYEKMQFVSSRKVYAKKNGFNLLPNLKNLRMTRKKKSLKNRNRMKMTKMLISVHLLHSSSQLLQRLQQIMQLNNV